MRDHRKPRFRRFIPGLALVWVLAWPLAWPVAAQSAAQSAAQTADAGRTVVSDIRAGVHGTLTRLVFELSRQVAYDVFVLANPGRVVLDLPEVGWRLPARPLPTDVGVLERVRYGLFKPGTTRVVLEVGKPVAVAKSFLLEPSGGSGWRLVLDLAETSEATFREAVGRKTSVTTATAASAASASTPPASFLPPKKPAVRVVAIDAGHGGADPGAEGRSGIYEKHITLAVARALKEEMESSGRFRVVLTRDRDVFIRLRDRIQLAREQGAELFISLHADSQRDARVRGLSVYTLSETASDAEAAALAEKENKADLIAGVDLSGESPEVAGILIDLAQRETMNASASFASYLVRELHQDFKLLRNSHRFAGFAVLKAPDVPSVLVEMGFLSNTQDEKILRSKEYRRKFARAVARGVENYLAQVEEAMKK